MLDTSVRLLRLLALLQGRRVWSGADLADRLSVSSRTVRNDIERLRLLGYQVTSRTGTAGGYRLGAGTALPPLLLDDEEAVAVVVGLRAAATGTVRGIEETSARALAKLEQTLPSRLRHRVDVLREATVAVGGRGPTVDPDTLTALATATQRRERVRFDYRGHDGETSVRDVEPNRLVHTGPHWYLLAWDVRREDWRTFRVDRLTPRVPTGPRFVPRELSEDAATHVLRGVASSAWPHRATVRLHAPITAMAERLPSSWGVLTAIDEHSCLLETGGPSLHEVAGFLGWIDVRFEVLDPPELRTLLARLAELYAPAGRDPG